MLSLRFLFPLLASLVLVAASPAQSPAPATAATVDLAPKWVKDAETRFVYKANSDRTDRVPAARAEQQQRTRQEMRLRRKVVETGPEGTVLELVFDRIMVVAMAGKMFIRVDTAEAVDPERANELEPMVRPAVNKPITVRLGADHRVKAIENIPTGTDAEGKPTQLVVDEELVRYSLAALYSLEKSPATAKVGEHWPVIESLPAGANAEFIVTHTRKLGGVIDAIAQVESAAVAEIKPRGAATGTLPLLIDFSCSTTFQWDVAAGTLKQMTVEQKTETHGVVQQMRSEQLGTVTITLAQEGLEPVEKKAP